MSHSSRHSGRRRHWYHSCRRTLAVALGLLVLCAIIAFLLQPSGSSHSFQNYADLTDASGSDSDSAQNPFLVGTSPQGFVWQGSHEVYPYSVVPGGVRTPRELQEASQRDPVVAKHYAGFNYQSARVVQLQKPQMVYVSYRMKDRIFWTKKRITLHKGEKVITDGKMIARTRCANRASSEVQNEVSQNEPAASVLEDPFGSDGTGMHIPFPGNFESSLMTRSPAAMTASAPSSPVSGLYPGGGFGGYPGIFPPPAPSGEKQVPPLPPPPPPPPPLPTVPEPSSIVLFSSGLVAIYVKYRASKK